MAEDGAAPTVVAEGLGKRFGKRDALSDVSFRVDQSQIVGLVGPNGSGKTTLIRLLLGLLRPTSGSVRVQGRSPSGAYRGDGTAVGYMPQGEAVYPELTGRQNVTFFAKLHRVARDRRVEQVQEALEAAAIAERADDRVTTLSGGMRRRVSLACTLVHRPQFLVLDEPTVGMDPELRSSMWESFHGLRDEGSLILLSTHYLAEAERADRVILLREGKILADDAPDRLMKKAKTKTLEDAFLKYVADGGTS